MDGHRSITPRTARRRNVADTLAARRPLVTPLLWAIAVIVHVGVVPVVSAAEPAELSCLPGTGRWEAPAEDSGTWILAGALCKLREARCPGFTTLAWTEGQDSAKIDIALPPPGVDSCGLVYQGTVGDFVFYYGEGALYAVDLRNLRIVTAFAQTAPGEPHPGPDRLAILDKDRLRVLGPGEGVPSLWIDEPVKDALELVWKPTRLVLVTEKGVRYWPLSEDGTLSAPANLSATKLVAGHYAVGPTALLQVVDDGRRIFWEPMDGEKPRLVTLGPEESVVGIASNNQAAAALTTDGVIARVIARDPEGLKDRVVLQTWGLLLEDSKDASGGARTTLASGDQWFIMDGGNVRRRAVPIDTLEFETWRQNKAFEYRSEGNWMLVGDGQAFLYHPDGRFAFSTWTLPKGKRRARFLRAPLEEAIGAVDHLETLDRRRALAVNAHGGAAILSARNSQVVPLRPKGIDSKKIAPFVRAGNRFVVPVLKGETVKRWYFYNKLGEHFALVAKGDITDALTPAERWYGYCLPGTACQLDVPARPRVIGNDFALTEAEIITSKRPTGLAWLGLALGLLLLLVVPIWRLGLGRKAAETPKTRKQLEETGRFVISAQLVFDEKGRRIPTPFDRKEFIDLSPLNVWVLRALAALVASIAVTVPMVLPRIQGEPGSVWLPIALGVAVPVGASIWTLLSWMNWNRSYLFRFGHAVEGRWHEEQGERKAQYVLPDGRFYFLKKAAALQAIPVVLYDPRSPRFAAHYVGSTDLQPDPSPEAKTLAGAGGPHGVIALGVIAALLLGSVVSGFVGFGNCFSEPLPESTLISLAADSEDWSMLAACMQECADFGDDEEAACETQCHRRQMRLALATAGIELDGDPDLTILETRSQLAEQMETLVQSLEKPPKGASCSTLAQRVAKERVWSAGMQEAITKVYGRSEVMESDASLAAVEARVAETYDGFFAPLCFPATECRTNLAACAKPPVCTGAADDLRDALCALAPAVVPLWR